jgi:hypothetical protein
LSVPGQSQRDIAEIVQMPDVKTRFELQGAVLVRATRERFAVILKEDVEGYAPLCKQWH